MLKKRDHALLGKERTDVGRPHNQGYPTRGMVTDHWLNLRNYEPARWPSGNPKTGYVDTDGSPTKSLILDLGRKERSNLYWQLNFGMKADKELYDLQKDPDCIHNLANIPDHTAHAASMRGSIEAMLGNQGNPRMMAKGCRIR